jgi:hypothetical protein
MMEHTCNSSIQETEAGGSPVEGQPGLHSKTLSPKEKEKEINKQKNPNTVFLLQLLLFHILSLKHSLSQPQER